MLLLEMDVSFAIGSSIKIYRYGKNGPFFFRFFLLRWFLVGFLLVSLGRMPLILPHKSSGDGSVHWNNITPHPNPCGWIAVQAHKMQSKDPDAGGISKAWRSLTRDPYAAFSFRVITTSKPFVVLAVEKSQEAVLELYRFLLPHLSIYGTQPPDLNGLMLRVINDQLSAATTVSSTPSPVPHTDYPEQSVLPSSSLMPYSEYSTADPNPFAADAPSSFASSSLQITSDVCSLFLFFFLFFPLLCSSSFFCSNSNLFLKKVFSTTIK